MTAEQIKGNGGDGKLRLSKSITIRTIDEIRAGLLALMSDHQHIEIDCSALEETDLQLVQLLLAARKSAQLAGKSFFLAEPASGVLRDVLLKGGLVADELSEETEEDVFWLKGSLRA